MKLWTAIIAIAPALVIASVSTSEVRAEFPFKKPKIEVPKVTTDPSEAWSKAMWKVNSLAQEGINQLPGLIDESDDAGKVKTRLDKATKKYEEARKYYVTVPDPRSVNEGASNYYLQLEAAVKNGRLALACLSAYKPIAKSFGEGKPVKDDKLDAFDGAARAYQEGAVGEDGAREAKGWMDTAVAFRELNPQVAEKKLKGELAIKRAAEDKAEKDAMDALFAQLKAWKAIIAEGTRPVPAEELAAYDQQLQALVAYRPEAPLYFDDAKWDVLAYNATFLEGDAQQAEIAKLWGGEIVQSGTTSKKDFKLTVKAEAERCYAFLPTFVERGGKATLEADWRAKKDGQWAHMWEIQKPKARGFCANKPVSVDLFGKLDYAGTKNAGIAWHIVSWDKSALPMAVASRLYTWTTDTCEPNHWKDKFMNPVPGTFYYGRGVPVVGGKNPDGTDGGGSDVAVPDAWKFEDGWMAPGSYSSWRTHCGGEDALNPLGKQLEACFIANDKAFQPKYDAAVAAVERATLLTYDAAVKRRDAIDAQWAKAQETRCMPIARKITAQMAAAYDELVDWFKATKPVPALDVKGFKRKQELAIERGSR